jgi:hypothetical protein
MSVGEGGEPEAEVGELCPGPVHRESHAGVFQGLKKPSNRCF